MKYFSMFSGIGGFEYGIEKATKGKCKCVGFSEINKYAIKIYKKHFPGNKNYGSATDINPKELPDFDMLCGGFPCQSFSIAGKRKGFQDTRGTLFFDIARIVKVKIPKILFLENVKGLVSHDEGRTLKTITKTLNNLGYYVDYRILNSKYFGVPQNRERIFILGFHIKCLKESVEGGQIKKDYLLEKIIKPYLLEKLLILYKEHPKQQEIKLKDLDLNSILLKEIIGTGLLKKSIKSREILISLIPNLQKYCQTEQQHLFATKEENWELKDLDLIGITLQKGIGLEEMGREEEFLNIEKLLKKCWEENSKNMKEFTTLMVTKAIIPNRIYTTAEICLITNLFILAWKELLSDWWKKASLNLIKKKGCILNDKTYKLFMGNREDTERSFFGRYFRGTGGRQIFPLGTSNKELNEKDSKICRCHIAGYHKGGSGTHIKQENKTKILDCYNKKLRNEVPTLTDPCHNNIRLMVEKVKGKVKVRKHIVNVKKLKKVLKEHKNYTTKEISDALMIKKTTVEHWFRRDNCFSIPDAEDWPRLKHLLKIKTDEFDKAITEFEIRDNEFDQSNRVYQKDGLSPTLTGMSGGQQHSMINDGYSIRRLTPVECERLQGFPELESLIKIKIQSNGLWIDLQKSYVNAENRNHKLQKFVGNVEKEESKETAPSVKKNLNIKNQQTKKLVQQNVHINCVEEKVEILNQEKSLSFVNYVESQNSFLQHIKKEDFVQMIVGINITLKKIITFGKEGLLQKGLHLIQVKDGKLFANLSGKEIMQLAEDVKKDSTTLKKHLKSIISNHLNLKNIDSNWITSFFYVISAIIGYIQKETEIKSSLNLNIYSRFGYTYGISDTQRYKVLGNAITTNVIQVIMEKIIKLN